MQAQTTSPASQLNVKNRLTLQAHLSVILRCLKDGYTQERIAAIVGVTKQAISKLIKRLIQHEYIRLVVRSSCNIYEILPRGQLILSSSGSLSSAGIGRLHNLRFKYSILSGRIPCDLWKKVEMVNWTKQVGDVYGVKVEVSDRSLIVSPGVFFGYKMADLLPRAREVADKIAVLLSSWHNLELGSPSSVGKPEFAVISPLPPLALSGMSLRTLDSWLDASTGKAEIEFTDMEQAQKFIDIPKTLEQMAAQIAQHRHMTELNHQSTTSQPEDNHKSTISQWN